MWLRCAALVASLVPGLAHADMVWPALYLVSRNLTWWVIPAGLLIEYIVIRFAFSLPPKKALLADLLANAASAIIGSIAVGLLGLLWEFGPGLLMYKWLDYGTFNPLTWAVTIVMASLINAAIEGFVLVEKFNVPLSKRTFVILALANGATVGISFASMFVIPVNM